MNKIYLLEIFNSLDDEEWTKIDLFLEEHGENCSVMHEDVVVPHYYQIRFQETSIGMFPGVYCNICKKSIPISSSNRLSRI